MSGPEGERAREPVDAAIVSESGLASTLSETIAASTGSGAVEGAEGAHPTSPTIVKMRSCERMPVRRYHWWTATGGEHPSLPTEHSRGMLSRSS